MASRTARCWNGPVTVQLRPAKPHDARAIAALISPYARGGILVRKQLINYFEDIQEFFVAYRGDYIVGCGALHVLWDDIAEIRTLAVAPEALGTGVGHLLVTRLEERARELELQRLFCLTFEVDFFASHGFAPIDGTPVGIDVYEHMLASHDDGVAEFLDLARMKPNTLGNTRMLKELD
ncbi:amino-acid N-acetyltransferase [Ancrocorticia populi]|uniref:amino-acid N-acetyltransferase n=1 Tax=Ancrocorticia populi TaxID=2175228 RepID=UPI001FAE9C63|nr:amino-acid N-acetyltransferase [Ancrocorticia populi]MDN6487023.1 amino-acid N-acetyltransferase [Ancrocorticia sp.]